MKFCLNVFLLILLAIAIPLVYAADPTPAAASQDSRVDYIYEKPTLEKFSQLYWALSKLDINSDSAIDHYFMINECDIFRDYSPNEFEWQKVRKSGREFIKENKNKFSLRFEIVQPLRLGEYDLKKHRFEILDKYQVKNTRRFEVLADDYNSIVCGLGSNNSSKYIEGYPRGLLIELSRPVSLTDISVDSALAKKYIDEKMEPFKALKGSAQTEHSLFEFRDAYVVMKVKFFSFRQEVKVPQGPYLAEVLGILEGIEIYGDKKRKMLLYSEDYRRKKKSGKIAEDLMKELPPSPMLLDSAALPPAPDAATAPKPD